MMATPKKHIQTTLHIDLNAADADDLQLLPGVGPVLARAIIADRMAAGPFRSVQDLGRVGGLGPKTLSLISAALGSTDAFSGGATSATMPEKAPLTVIRGFVEPEPELVRTLPSNVVPLRAPTPTPAPLTTPAPSTPPPNLFADVNPDNIRAPKGWSWTDGQIAAIRAIRQHLRKCRGQPFVLKGYAGTGKTTLLVEALRTFAPPLMLAPTHKARNILEPKAIKLNGRTMTVAGWLGYVPEVDPETGDERFVRKPIDDYMARKRYSPSVPVILDEVSMVDAQRWAEIMHIVKTYRLQFIAMGDPLQLPPIGEEMSPAFAVESGVELTEVMRSQGALTAAVLGVRERIYQEVPPIVQVSYKDAVSEIEVIKSRDDVVNKYLEALRRGEDAMIIAYTNKVVDWCNAAVRARIAGKDKRPFVPGELLVLVKPYTLEGPPAYNEEGEEISTDVTFHSETRVVLESVEEAVHPEWGDKCWKVSIRKVGFQASASSVLDRGRSDEDGADDEGVRGPVYAYDPSQRPAIKRHLAKLQREHAKLKADGKRAEMEIASKVIANYRRSYLHARPAYATTCHKSQGSTWQTVLVLQGDISKNQDVFERNRMIYVAYSRASTRLLVYGG